MKTIQLSLLTLFAFIALTSITVKAQNAPKIAYTETNTVFINEIKFDGKNKEKELISLLGEPSKKIDYPSGEVSFFYEEMGLVFFLSDGVVKGLGVNFSWDGDEKFPETTFTGTLNLGELQISTETKSDAITAIETVGFDCPFPLMCFSNNKEAKTKCTMAFKETNLTQVVFMMK